MKTIQTILHPTDLSESAKPAFELALRLAHDHGARLIVLHVSAPPVIYGEMGMTVPIPEMQKEILEADRTKLEGLAADSGAECRVVEGAAAGRDPGHCPERVVRLDRHGDAWPGGRGAAAAR